VTFVIASIASMDCRGFSGFVAELQVIIGAWQAFFPTLRGGVGNWNRDWRAYTLRALQKAFFGDGEEQEGVAGDEHGA